MSQKILVVEDDEDIAEDLLDFLTHYQFDVEMLDDGARVLNAVKRIQPDLILLDVMLPNKNGVECCQAIREFSNVPIIMLTAKTEQADKLAGLGVGADDYICKPFDITELLLRIRAVLRRTCEYIQFSSIGINQEKQEIRYRGARVDLSSLQFKLFHLLHASPERVFTREQIIDQAYSDIPDISDRAIDTHIKNIRKKFKQAGLDLPVIQSVYGAGYRFNPKT